MEHIKELKEQAYKMATNERVYIPEERIEAMKAYAMLCMVEKKD